MLRLKKFRIKNYKSIADSGDCYLAEGITVLAGKNESGKTSILEALEDFDTGKKIRESAKPIRHPDNNPEISMAFEFDAKTIQVILDELAIGKKLSNSVVLEIVKTFPASYSFEHFSLERSGLSTKSEIQAKKNAIRTGWKLLEKIRSAFPQLAGDLFSFEFADLNQEKSKFTAFETTTQSNLEKIDDPDTRLEFTTLLARVGADLDKILELTTFEAALLKEITERYVPNFILFNSFDDIFPNKIPFGELETNAWIADLAVVSDLDVTTIKSSTDREKHKHKKDLNIRLNENYEKFWTQDLSNLSVDWDSQNLYFWIEEDAYPYEPSLRSKGRQWHLAFYIKISARAKEEVPNIVLIDEPGLFLHAKAQKDILAILEDSAKRSQLIFSTHSPYLLEADKLNRIRLVYRTKESGTTIVNKVHALADKETLTPILTAIGLELNSDISSINRVNNVVVEGPSDVFYLNALKLLLKRESVNFIFGGGAGNMPLVGTILHGWGCKVLYLYDNDQGRRDGEKNLTRNWLITAELILSVLNANGSIEDVFAPDDFRKFILNEANASAKESNSEYVKKNKLDKVLIARKFLESVHSNSAIKLGSATYNNFKKLFDVIESKF